MRFLVPAGASLFVLASCTLFVAIDDDVSAGGATPDGAAPTDAPPSLIGDVDGGGLVPEARPDATARPGCPGPPDDPDLVGWWPLDEKEGVVAHDCSPSGVDLTPLNSSKPPSWTTGKIGGGADFAATATCFNAARREDFAFDKGESFTIMAWVNARQLKQPDNTGRWFAAHKSSPWGWHLGADDGARLEIDYEYGPDLKTQVSASVVANTWYHFAATYKPRESAAFLDGVETQRVVGEKIPASFEPSAATRFRIGCRDVNSNVFDGIIDDMRIYRRILTNAEIAALAARGR